MNKLEFRPLRADEIEVRAQSVKQTGMIALLYKDARCDMALLDETVGALNWQRSHSTVRDTMFCTVSIWDDDKKQWISKSDAGVKSNTEAEKGESSDSFKRACTNFGIGRELYTAGFIWITLNEKDFGKDGKLKTKFAVSKIAYDQYRNISSIEIIDNYGSVRYTRGSKLPTAKDNAAKLKADIVDSMTEHTEQLQSEPTKPTKPKKVNIATKSKKQLITQEQINQVHAAASLHGLTPLTVEIMLEGIGVDLHMLESERVDGLITWLVKQAEEMNRVEG